MRSIEIWTKLIRKKRLLTSGSETDKSIDDVVLPVGSGNYDCDIEPYSYANIMQEKGSRNATKIFYFAAR